MPKVSVYVPDELHSLMKVLDLSPSELLQTAIREAARVAEKQRELERFLAEGEAIHGGPTPEVLAEVDAIIANAERFNPPEAKAS